MPDSPRRPPALASPPHVRIAAHEIDQPLERTDKLRAEVGVRRDAVAQSRPEALGRHAEGGAHAFLPRDACRPPASGRVRAHRGACRPTRRRTGGRSPTRRARAPGRRCRHSFEPSTRWSTRTPSRRGGDGPNSRDECDEVVDPVHRLDDDAQLAEIVTPHVLDELGIVCSFDPDAAAARRHERMLFAGDRPEFVVRCVRVRAPSAGRTSVTGRAFEQKPARASTRNGAGAGAGRGVLRLRRSTARCRRRTRWLGPRRPARLRLRARDTCAGFRASAISSRMSRS